MIVDRFPMHIEEGQDEDQILFPSYHEEGYFDKIAGVPALTPSGDARTALPAWKRTSEASFLTESTRTVVDDTAIRKEPREHVDYLSHDWTEDELSASWRSIVSKQTVDNNSRRLENASWRAWMKAKYRLKTVAPETLEWKKDSDVTWLYGPLHKRHNDIQARPLSPSGSSQVSTPDSYQVQRPILKKRTLAETLLQRSLSACSISQQTPCTPQTPKGTPNSCLASATIFVRPGQCYSDLTLNSTFSGLKSPATAERRRIQFNESVEQRVALDVYHEPEEIQLSCALYEEDDDDDDFSSEDDITSLTLSTSSLSIVSQKPATRSRPFLTTRSQTIAVLPSTTLKTDEGSAQRPPLARGKPFQLKPEPGVLPTLPRPPNILTPSRYFFEAMDEGSGKMGVSWEANEISTYENEAGHGAELVPTLATPLDPYDTFKVQLTDYGACLHYEEDEQALLVELGCI